MRAAWRKSSLPSRRLAWLVVKEFRELLASRSFWLLLLMIGPLVGHGFITAVGLYAEASGIGGGPAALPPRVAPFDGLLGPAFWGFYFGGPFFFPFSGILALASGKPN